MQVTYSVPFVHGKERPRFGGGVTRTSDVTAANEDEIAYAYKGASLREHRRIVCAPQHVPVTMTIHCTIPAPRQRPKWCPKFLWDALGGIPFVRTPDYDNIAKEHSDALNGVAYHDDAQVTEAHIYKDPQLRGGREVATVTIEWEDHGQEEG